MLNYCKSYRGYKIYQDSESNTFKAITSNLVYEPKFENQLYSEVIKEIDENIKEYWNLQS
jgi:hypothetical protein